MAQPHPDTSEGRYEVHHQDVKLILEKEAAVRQLWINGRLPSWRYLKALDELLWDSNDSDGGSHQVVGLVSPREMAIRRFQLSSKEVEVLDILCEGEANRRIGQRLFIAEQTVKFHLTNIYRKLEANNRTRAAHIWRTAQFG